MKILVISSTPWSSNNSFGNTYSNLFKDIPGLTFASIALNPVTEVDPIVSSCFSISEKDLVENMLHVTRKTGHEINLEILASRPISGSEAKKLDLSVKSFARKKRWMLLFWARDFIWKFGRWNSPDLRHYLDTVQPDLIFQPIYFVPHPNVIAQYVKRYTDAPMIGYVSDDVYTLHRFSLSPLFWIDRLIKRRKVKETIQQCELLYVISQLQKQEYEKIFRVPCKILTKSLDFSCDPPVKSQYHSPLKLVFAGNIGTNRWKSLAMIADALEQINQSGVRAQLYIYTTTPLTTKMEKALQRGMSSFVMGAVPASEILKIQTDADILVHVEALDLKNRLVVRQSFSTKLVDYFKAARLIFAVGPRDVASIQHLIDNDAAVVASNQKEIYVKLKKIIETPQIIADYGKKAYECGRKHHNKEAMQSMLKEDLVRIARQ